ncbi:ARM repeat-containing protein [Teratosphaeria nubilosa]|uniref:ARM repeat-containing protein n=1 Tax=Teratosphaeria nubilosa TaxID=161662 RepID=A0A6G1L1W1_9PEZI|nr:ARM repeat-containing protein [Teratosphaeria nubilosa]
MDSNVSKLLQDKLYDKRKVGALELENIIRNALAENNHEKIAKIVHQLCHDYAYAVHAPHARNGGLIGLAAAAIALGGEVARYLKEIVPPVFACFSDQDARVRYYACESMYNIAKVAKGEILVYFNEVFDALCKLAADTELSVKNGAELLDRLVKDIVSESAATYASIFGPEGDPDSVDEDSPDHSQELKTAFSLPRFIPLLQERIHVLNPFTRTFLVSWITLLDSIPDLELVAYLPSFLGGLLKFLSDPNQDVHTTTRVALDRFLTEIKKIAAVKKGIAESRRSKDEKDRKASGSSEAVAQEDSPAGDKAEAEQEDGSAEEDLVTPNDDATDGASTLTASADDDAKEGGDFEDEWIPGQDVQIDYLRILDILITFLSESSEEEIQVTALKWIEAFLDICPEDILAFTPRLLAQLLPALSHDVDHVKQAAHRVNQSLMAYIMSLPEEHGKGGASAEQTQVATQVPPASAQQPAPSGSMPAVPTIRALAAQNGDARRDSAPNAKTLRKTMTPEPSESITPTPRSHTPELQNSRGSSESQVHTDLDYEGAVNALTLQFLHEHEATRVAALAWLIMLHRKSPRKILAIQDATFPALLKTLSDPAEAVVTRDLLLLSQISKSSDDSYFTSFMVNLLKLFTTDRRLLESRGNLIIRQLCMSLSPEKIFRTMADCLERDSDDDVEFASIMVQNLNNNLITAPELQDLRKRLRNLDSKDGQTFFTVLFKAWCVNAVATFSLCLLAQAYEQAYNLLQIFAELEMTVNMLIQIDKLVQLLESPVFTYLRMQLLEPERFPHLYKCLYGLLMLLPQSSAFAALKNRLNSVSAIGYLHIVPRAPATPSSVSTFERQTRLRSKDGGDGGGIKWTELLDKFRVIQDRVRRNQQRQLTGQQDGANDRDERSSSPEQKRITLNIPNVEHLRGSRAGSAQSLGRPPPQAPGAVGSAHNKGKGSLSNLGRFTSGVGVGARKGKK